jgi:hypothetical protein
MPIRFYLYLGALITLLAGFGAFTVHERRVGAAHEISAVQEATRKAQAKADAQTAILAAKAAQAEVNYNAEHQSLISYVNLNPVSPVRLCLRAGPSGVPKGPGHQSGGAGSGTASGDVLTVPETNNQLRSDAGPDISGLLSLLAEHADQVSAQARELQSR